MIKIYVWLLLFFFSFLSFSKEGKETKKPDPKLNKDDPSLEFKDTKFLQVDRITIPKELKNIEEQIRQNIMDVIFLSKLYTPVYSQKLNGYSDSYKKFYGLQVRIDPIAGENDSYLLDYFFYNWTTNKEDKTLRKKISKYNVLNEVRIRIFQLMFGKEYVEKNKDRIDVQNYDRIQEVRKSIAEQAQIIKKKSSDELKINNLSEDDERDGTKKKKKKLIREDKEEEEKNQSSPPIATSSDLQPEGQTPSTPDSEGIKGEIDLQAEKIKIDAFAEKRARISRSNKKGEVKKKDQPVNESIETPALPNAPEPEKGEPAIPHIVKINAVGGILYESIESLTSDNKVKTLSSFKYLNIGMNLDIVQEKEKPIGYNLLFKFGMPILKNKYEVPVHKHISFITEKYYDQFKFGVGFDYSPINFVNVPDFGGDYQVFENDFLWGALRIEYQFKEALIGGKYGISFLSSSNQNASFSGSKFELYIKRAITTKYLGEFKISAASLSGDLTAGYRSALLNIYYIFEN